MKKFLFFFSILIVGVLSANDSIEYPKLTFTYNWQSVIMDKLGAWYFKKPVTKEYRDSLATTLPYLQEAWEKEAPILFGKVFDRFPRGFHNKKQR